MDDVDVTVPVITDSQLESYTPEMQALLSKKYGGFIRWQKQMKHLVKNTAGGPPPQVETEITATTATPAENESVTASDEADTMKAGVLPGDVTPPTLVGGGAPPQQALVFSPADVPLPKSGVPRAILTCRPNSHPFPERVLNLDQPAKVGRSVARCRQAPNNAIFDCKVLSRNHALLWYENGKFYLQDTKSSNGTFVNNQRLSKGSEESPAQEVCSGDIVQFGVDVVENSRKVTHGCIVATLRLFLPDGKEAKASPSTALIPAGPGSSITTQELYQLSQCIQEALHREQVIQNKMATLQRVVSSTQEASENNWKAMIEEDRLLNRIETLEAQLQTCAKSSTDDKLREEITRLQKERERYEDTAKESLKKALQEKLEALRRVQELEYTASNSEDECARLREVYEAAQKEIGALANRADKHQKEIVQLQTQLKEAEELNQTMTEEKTALENQIQELQKADQVLAAKIESLRADNDFAKEQLSAMKARFDQVKKAQYIEDGLETLNSKENMPNHDESPTQPEKESELSESKEMEISLNSTTETTLIEKEMTQRVLSNELQAKVCELEEQLEQLISLEDKGRDENQRNVEELQAEIAQLRELLTESREKINAAQLELAAMKEAQQMARQAGTEELQPPELSEDTSALKAQLSAASKQVQDQVCQIVRLQGELSQSEQSLSELREQFNAQRQQLAEHERHRRFGEEELSSLENLLEEERKARSRTEAASEAVKKQLHEAQNSAKQHQNEAEHLRKKVRTLTEELRNRANMERSLTPNHTQESLQEECEALRVRLRTAEEEATMQRDENAKLLAECERLQTSCSVLGMQSSLPSVPGDRGDRGDRGDWPDQLEKLHQEAQSTRQQLQESAEELALLKEKYSVCALEKAQLQQELKAVSDERQLLLYQSKATSACSIIPLCILVLAILLGFYPTLSYFTATAETP
ncbi:sarcolemmal membrane-associated protein-like isoform X2 [Dermacentor albipictus]|uniref:sarcolemmal membrane-associated protein-like isoform X2 n=1 Tax=Dermacentor albipictus TaxID=60249 RepID=UPI0031FD48ED